MGTENMDVIDREINADEIEDFKAFRITFKFVHYPEADGDIINDDMVVYLPDLKTAENIMRDAVGSAIVYINQLEPDLMRSDYVVDDNGDVIVTLEDGRMWKFFDLHVEQQEK